MVNSSCGARYLRGRLPILVVLLVASCVFAVFGAKADAQASKANRLNVVLIMTDDQRFDEMGYMPKTQRLLGDQGTEFKNFFTSFPLCCPSRMTTYTGQLAHNHGIDGNFPPEGYGSLTSADKKRMLQVWLRKAGYRTSHVGKYLNGYGDLNELDVPIGWSDWHGTVDQTSYDFFNFWINDNGRLSKYGSDPWNQAVRELSKRVARREFDNYDQLRSAVLELLVGNADGSTYGTTSRSRYIVDVLADRATRFVRRAAKSPKPFFLEFAPPAPHREDLTENALYRGINPRVPPRYEEYVDGLSFGNRPNYDEADVSDKPSLIAALDPVPSQTTPLPPVGKDVMIDYYKRGRAGSLRATDDAVARIVGQLKRSGELSKTLIILTSDNGWMLGEHRIAGDKYVPYEESIRVPMVMRGPRVPKKKVRTALSMNVDLTSTILEATRARRYADRRQEGISLLPVARGLASAEKRTAVPLEATRPLFVLPGFPYEWDQPYYGVRTKDWKYVKWSYDDEQELYNLVADPYEMTNLASNPAYAAKLAELRSLADQLRACKGSSCVR